MTEFLSSGAAAVRLQNDKAVMKNKSPKVWKEVKVEAEYAWRRN
jgi:hypothetical protein